MKRNTLLTVAAMLFTIAGYSQTVLSHSGSQVPATPAFACINSSGGFSAENNYWRTYTPADFGQVEQISIEGGEIGVSFNDIGATDPTLLIEIKAYTTSAPFPDGVLTIIATGIADITVEDNLTLVTFDFDEAVNVDSSEEIIIKVKFPSGESAIVDTRLAQNTGAETAPTYFSTDSSCGGIPITTFAEFGLPGSGLINLRVNEALLGLNDAALSSISVFPNPVTEVLHINVPSPIEINDVTLYDVFGKVTNASLSNDQIIVSGLSKGIYILNIETTAGTYTEKIVIE